MMTLETLTAILQEEFGEADLESLLWTARDEFAGVCLHCGGMNSECEPDARNLECEHCGQFRVFGVEEAFLMTA